MFERIKTPKRKSFHVAQQILEKIQAGIFPPGDKLPPERTLSREMAVSRTVVREAMSALQLAGIVETRVGDGSYVKNDGLELNLDVDPQHEHPLLEGLKAGIDILEVIEARKALDVAAIHLAIENAQASDLQVPNELIHKMGHALDERNFATYLELSLNFHVAIAAAGGNRFIEETVASLVNIVRKDLWLLERNYTSQKAEESHEIHCLMLEAIKRRDVEMAVQAVTRHYREYPSLKQGQAESHALNCC